MSEPVTSAPAHPWRRTARTIFAWVTGIAPMIPLIVDAGNFSEATPGLAGALAISSAVTRILALPQVETFLRSYVPWLAAQDVEAGRVVAHTTDSGTVVAGEASTVPTGQEIKMPTVESVRRKPARRRKVKAGDAGDTDVVTILVVVLVVVVLVLLLNGRL